MGVGCGDMLFWGIGRTMGFGELVSGFLVGGRASLTLICYVCV